MTGAQQESNESAAEREAMEQLRTLLFGQEREEITQLQQRLSDPELQATDVSEVLPLAVRLRTNRDDQLNAALAPAVEASLRILIARNLTEIAEALYPVIGPAIRRSIAASIQQLLESTNQILEHTFTVRGLRWRLEAARTGLPVAEVALRHCLEFRVEQAFLINSRDGLPLLHVASPSVVEASNQDLVAGMLTAIQDFVRDSFAEAGGQLDQLQVGELTVVIEQGPQACLAAVVRGSPPSNLRERLQERLERVHHEFGPALRAFDGDSAPFETGRPILEDCLYQHLRPGSRASLTRVWVLLAVGVVALAGWGWHAWSLAARRAAYLAALDAQPGISLLSAEGGRAQLLWDPLADVDPLALLAEHDLEPEQVALTRHAYASLEPELVLLRARHLLAPPAGVTLRLDAGRLELSGQAPHAWIRRALSVAPALAGVERVDATLLVDRDQQELDALLARHARTPLRFRPGAAALDEPSRAALAALGPDLARLEQLARALGHELRGRVTSPGAPEATLLLTEARLERALEALGLDARPAWLQPPTRPWGSEVTLEIQTTAPENQ